ncbi:homoserine kinase [Arthrobacter sp. H14-L1]|uniref:homoserine kinase n=1 Tax=Arthrobacter sp. H14-L1 TaxID=2996697 RepID=UPI00227131BE|nr:homoserine kinase [Arthrobacter sp. H14-L1]MCY0905332.1 homoserine kinase [Arthrobacter sp. H14-L1]
MALNNAMAGGTAGTIGLSIASGQRVTVRVPATTANLGPGFDSLGMAVSLYDSLTVETFDGAADAGGERELLFELRGEGAAALPRDASHLAVRAMDAAFSRLGYRRSGLKITADNALPHGRGLGSSASAIVAAVTAANALVPEAARQDAQWVLQLTSELEGHPDNVAPAIFGAVAISWQEGGRYRSARVTPSTHVIPIAAIPAVELSTEVARAMLPVAVPHADAAANAGRTALLIHALKDDPALLLAGTEDFLHQSFRAAAMAGSAALMDGLRAEGFAAFISGAGPTVMTLADGDAEAQRAVAFITAFGASTDQQARPGDETCASWRVLRLNIDADGAKVELHRW